MKRLLATGVTCVALLSGVLLVRTARYGQDQLAVEPASMISIPSGAAERLAAAVRLQTISHEDPDAFRADAFEALHEQLRAAFPQVHATLKRETVSAHSLLYTWVGSDTSLKPILLAGHLDVVPVEAGTEEQWQEDPFGGRIADGFIWGRGAIDNKSAVVGMLEAVELLLHEGFTPKRTVYLAFGHDEEVGGTQGAREIANLLKRRGVALQMVLDEGGVISERILSGVDEPVAMVGIAEKGFVSVELTTRGAGGHSSLPPPQSSIGVLSAAIARLESKPMPARLDGPTRQLLDRIGPGFPFARRVGLANLWLSRPLVLRGLERSSTTNAMARTTTAVTIFQAGTKDNVLASQARAVVNFRIVPGDSIAGVLAHVRRVVADERVEVKIAGRFSAEPSSISSTDSDAFRALERAIRRVASDVIVAPYLVIVATDSRYYGDLSAGIFRFLPLRLTQEDLARMHGSNERVAIRHYEDAIRVYRQLMIDAAGT
ncbi:MAG: M20 family peptidase [Gemmatimonadota bacterium]